MSRELLLVLVTVVLALGLLVPWGGAAGARDCGSEAGGLLPASACAGLQIGCCCSGRKNWGRRRRVVQAGGGVLLFAC